MTHETWPEEVEKTWTYWEMLRRLGFSSDQISIGVALGTAHGTVAQLIRVQLDAQGKTFGIHSALWPKTPEEFSAVWRRFVSWANDKSSSSALAAIYQRHLPECDSVGMATALLDKGFHLPCAGS